MAKKERELKEGLHFFPLDIDYFDDTKILKIEDKFGLAGSVVSTRILCYIYRNGYHIKWDDGEALAFARKVGNGITWQEVNSIVNQLLECEFFDKGMFDSHKILTSRGIQKRWMKIIEDCNRKARIKSDFNLLIDRQKSDLEGKKSEESLQSKEEESKEEEIEIENNTACDLRDLDSGLVRKAADFAEAICDYFEVKTVVTSKTYNSINDFATTLAHRNELDIGAQALKNYMAYKARSQQAKHGVLKWIGTKSEYYRDGEWTMTDWDKKNKNYNNGQRNNIKGSTGQNSPEPGKDYSGGF